MKEPPLGNAGSSQAPHGNRSDLRPRCHADLRAFPLEQRLLPAAVEQRLGQFSLRGLLTGVFESRCRCPTSTDGRRCTNCAIHFLGCLPSTWAGRGDLPSAHRWTASEATTGAPGERETDPWSKSSLGLDGGLTNGVRSIPPTVCQSGSGKSGSPKCSVVGSARMRNVRARRSHTENTVE